MIVHALMVILYLLSCFAFVVALEILPLKPFYFAVDILSFFCSSTTQMMICYIFWNMDNIQFVPVPAAQQNVDEEDTRDDAIEEVQVKQTDYEFDL